MTRQNSTATATGAVSRETRRTPRSERRGSRSQIRQTAVRRSVHAHQ